MAAAKVKVGDVVLVTWQDHYSRNNGWKNVENIGDYAESEYYCQSAGAIVSINKRQVVIAQNWHNPANDDWAPMASDFMTILINCIDDIKVVKKKAF